MCEPMTSSLGNHRIHQHQETASCHRHFSALTRCTVASINSGSTRQHQVCTLGTTKQGHLYVYKTPKVTHTSDTIRLYNSSTQLKGIVSIIIMQNLVWQGAPFAGDPPLNNACIPASRCFTEWLVFRLQTASSPQNGTVTIAVPCSCKHVMHSDPTNCPNHKWQVVLSLSRCHNP